MTTGSFLPAGRIAGEAGNQPRYIGRASKRLRCDVARWGGAIRAPWEKSMTKTFAHFANWVAVASGHPIVFGVAALTVVAWLVTGPFFSYSDTWQLVMNTWTNVATFLMVFLIQNSQNRDSSAIQAKLDELIRTSAARNSLVGIEKLTPEEIESVRKSVETLARQRSETSRS
jgi:low affinity Fe/Cu permease